MKYKLMETDLTKEFPKRGSLDLDNHHDSLSSISPCTTPLDSLTSTTSPCHTPLDAIELEYDNYDGQFVFYGDKYEQNVQLLERQMNNLAETQIHSDEKYTRAKQENAGLQARILMLEEQLRDVEIRSEERLAEEEKRHRELIARVDREKILQVENCAIRLQNMEIENEKLKQDTLKYRNQFEKCKQENETLSEQVEMNEGIIASLTEEMNEYKSELRKCKQKIEDKQQIIDELTKDLDLTKQEKLTALTALSNTKSNQFSSPLQVQLDSLRIKNKELQESHDELQAMLLSQGKTLLSGSNTLAAEFAAMSEDDKVLGLTDNASATGSGKKMKSALQEQQEVNAQLRTYIENILTTIVEHQPELLEVKMKKSS